MEAKEYLDLLRDDGDIIRVAKYDDAAVCIGRGIAEIIDHEHNIAAMLGDCGFPNKSKIKAGAIIKFQSHPEVPNESRIVGSPAYAVPTVIDGTRMP